MRIINKFIVITCAVAGFFFGYLNPYGYTYLKKYWKLDQKKIQTARPTRRTILRKKVFSGTLIPHKELKIETHVTGLVDKLFVHVGDHVQRGAPLVRIKIMATPKEVEAAESELRLASIALHQARSKYLRSKQLFNKKMLAIEAYEADLAAWEQAKEKLATAQKKRQIIQCGYADTKGAGANILKAHTKGTILELFVKEGSLVQGGGQKSGSTPIAVIGDMDHFLFSANVSELDVVHLSKGMTFTASLNADNDQKLQVTLTKIAPKANPKELQEGMINFAVEGVIVKPKKSKVLLRAGYLANAEIILERVSNVRSVPESLIQMEGKNYFVRCLHNGKPIKKNVVLGLSDGIYVEVKEGLTDTDLLILET